MARSEARAERRREISYSASFENRNMGLREERDRRGGVSRQQIEASRGWPRRTRRQSGASRSAAPPSTVVPSRPRRRGRSLANGGRCGGGAWELRELIHPNPSE